MKKINKILTMTTGELLFRLRRHLKKIQEQLKLDTPYRVSKESCQLDASSLLGFEKNSDKVKKNFHLLFPQEIRTLMSKTKKIIEHRFDLLGYQDLHFGKDIDWTLEPVRRKKIPYMHWSKVLRMRTEHVGDLKILWELNRHQYLVPLGQAYFLTGEDAYAEEIIHQISDWRLKNPPTVGVNWASSLEVAFRLISWIWAVRLIRESKACDEDFLISFAVWIGEHARHIERYLSFYESPNTHLTGEALGLFYAGTFFPNLPEAARWRKSGEDALFKMLPIHLLEDGGYVERTIWYHQYTLSFYLHFFILLKNLQKEIPLWAWHRLEKGINFFLYSIKPDKTIPLVGDDDGGFFLPLSCEQKKYPSALLAVSAALYQSANYKALCTTPHPEILWLLGIDGERSFQQLVSRLPGETSKGFQETGYFFLRSGWDAKSNYMVFDCGPHGWLNGGHAHADLLSFHVVAGEKAVIEDPGTYLYINEQGWRDFFRGPKNHASVLIDGRHPAVPAGPFHWEKVPHKGTNRFYTGIKYDFVAGNMMHDTTTMHQRKIHFIKPNYFLVIDSILGEGRRDVEVRLPLSTGKWSLSESGCWQEENQQPSGIVPLGLDYDKFKLYLESAWISSVYGKKEPSSLLVIKGKDVLPFRMAYLIDLSGTKSIAAPSFALGKKVFKLNYKGDIWIGFGTLDQHKDIQEYDIDTDYRAGLIKSSSNEIDVFGLYDGSYCLFQNKAIKSK